MASYGLQAKVIAGIIILILIVGTLFALRGLFITRSRQRISSIVEAKAELINMEITSIINEETKEETIEDIEIPTAIQIV
jgi:hypothetical protein